MAKAKWRGKKKNKIVFLSANINEKKRVAWYTASCASVSAGGSLRMLWRTVIDDNWRKKLPCMKATAHCVMLIVDKVSNHEETMLQLKENNVELIKLVKEQSNANYTIKNKHCALV